MRDISAILYAAVFTTICTTPCHSLLVEESETPTPQDATLPFRNPDLPWSQRVDDLVSRLTMEEIQGQLSNGGGPPAPAIPRLGIGHYQWWSNCGRGDASAPGNATAFPQAVGLAAAFSPDLRYRVAKAGAIELRAKFNYFTKNGIFDHQTGLSCYSPNVDLLRDPRWGRNQETPGEDPYMTGVYAQAFVRGIHGDHPRYIRASTNCKHFAGCAGPGTYPFNANIGMRDLRMSFLPQFRMCVEAGSFGVYTSYVALNGTPTTADPFLLTQVLRNEWKFKGYVQSDVGAVEKVRTMYNFTQNNVDTAAACFNAGCNMEAPGGTNPPIYMSLLEAVKQGKISEDFIREQAKPVFLTRMRLGEFDPPEMNPYAQLDQNEVVESEEHQALAVEAALKSFVLLKNQGVLPFTREYDTIGVVGPMANNSKQIFGDYAANTDSSYITSPLDGVMGVSSKVKFASGCDDNVCANYDGSKVKAAVTGTQINLVMLGTGTSVEAEGKDRPDMELPGHQLQVLRDTMTAAPATPLLLVLYSASAVNITGFADDSGVSAILQCFFPAQAAGTALKHLLLNDVPGAVPAGRLPYTWPAKASQIPPMDDYSSMAGRTYRYFDDVPLYPFGYGLSYVSFTYLNLSYPDSIQAGDNLTGSFTLINQGKMDADEAVQVYISWYKSSVPSPRLQLAWFDRVTVPAGKSLLLDFHIDPKQMALWADDGWEIRAGDIMFYVGGQQPDQVRKADSNVLGGMFTIHGNKKLGSY